ncbi:hypothetical protein J2S43_003147 [Catenuloplanes nepalensis]|uniref:DUF559 domain-containing protein n=1 Tax=Catenuloplanes nepalensis TaxID=587533 RepID=A0ABT9MT71_9ACTN|nr:DUF559 domain-containing protein [Catenuloplanes nepalensis]MDP9794635.1 hypothetical protein [Catenuloplanes nepalensis]
MTRSETHRRLPPAPFRRRDAVAAGLVTPAQLSGPAWQRLYQGVYVDAAVYRSDDHHMWCEAALLAAPPASAIGALSAAYLWGVDLLRSGSPVTVVVPANRRPREQPRLSVVRAELPPGQVEVLGGVRLTTPDRTAFDLGRGPDRVAAVVAVDAMLHRRLVTVEGVAALASRHPGWPGVSRMREVLAIAEPGSASPMETRLRLIIVDGGLPRPVAQHEVRTPEGRFIGRVDLAYPELRIVLEYEGDHHRDPATYRNDIARFNRFQAAGWTALRFTADDVFKRPQKIVADVRRAMVKATALHAGTRTS